MKFWTLAGPIGLALILGTVAVPTTSTMAAAPTRHPITNAPRMPVLPAPGLHSTGWASSSLCA